MRETIKFWTFIIITFPWTMDPFKLGRRIAFVKGWHVYDRNWDSLF